MKRTTFGWIVAVTLLAGAARANAEGKPAISGKVTASGGAAQIIVYVENAPAAPAKAGAPPRIVQRNTQFVPEFVVVEAGQSVDFPNEDKFYHNVFSVTPGNEFDLGLYRSGVTKSAKLPKVGEVDVFCNIHPDMVTRVLVVPPGEHHVTAGSDGKYTLPSLPPGSYTVVAWSAGHEPQKKTVEVKAGAAARADFTLPKRGGAKSHLNKDGQQYGRYH